MNLWSILARARHLHPASIAAVEGGHRLSYRALGQRTDRLALRLRTRGVCPDDRVAVLLPNSVPYLESYFAAAGLGAILVPLNLRQHPDELGFILRDSGATTLIADAALAPLVAATLERDTPVRLVLVAGDRAGLPRIPGAEPYPSDTTPTGFEAASPAMDRVAQLYYTSGTTGTPKGVMLTHRNVWVHSMAAIAELGLGEGDVWAHVAPMFHLADAWATFAITWAGGTHVMVPRFDPEEVLATFERERVTITNLVPTMLNLMVKHEARGRYDYRSLRRILSGGAPITPAVVEAIVATFGCEYVQTYGMTETSPYLTLSLLKRQLLALSPEEQLRYRAKTGRPFAAVELRVVDEAGAPVAADEREVGEIQARGETVTPGYWNRPDATREAFTDDGWLRTGDLAVIDAEGYLSIVDRKKDMIITGGEKVYSTEVEAVLYRHPAVLEAAVYGSPDDTWGEVVSAAVVLLPGREASAEELAGHCRAHLAGYKVPRLIQFLTELPRTGSGKILKRALARGDALTARRPGVAAQRRIDLALSAATRRRDRRRMVALVASVAAHVLLLAWLVYHTAPNAERAAAEGRRLQETTRAIQLAFQPPSPPATRPREEPQPPQPAIPLTPGPDETPGSLAQVTPQPEPEPNAPPATLRQEATRPTPGETDESGRSEITAPAAGAADAPAPPAAIESEAQRLFGRPRAVPGANAGVRDRRPWESPVELDSRGCTLPPPDPSDSTIPAGMAVVAGRIYREDNGQPLAGARLQILGTPFGTFSNGRGDYRLVFDRTLVDRCRTQSVRVSAPGYAGRDVILFLGEQSNSDVPLRRY